MKKLFSKILTFVLVFVLGTTTLFSSGCNGGIEFKGLIVGGVTTTYRVGDEVNFDNAIVKVEYNDEKENKTLTKNEYTVELPNGMSMLEDLTKEEGTYTIKFVYLDPLFKGERREKAIVINVVPEDVEYIEGEVLTPTSFTLPETYGVYQSNVASATNERNNEETDSSFEGKFMDVEDKNYYVGTDNGFKFLPKLRVNDEFRKFTAKIEISVEIENAPVELVASTPVDKVVTYTLNDEEVATVDIYNHVYKFEDALDGKKVIVSIEPSADIYDWDEGVLTAEFVIVKDAYNVHNAVEFSVLDNTEEDHHWSGKNLTDVNWTNWKTENNINATTDGIILHDNITIVKENLPQKFFWKNDVVSEYTDANGNKEYADTYAYDNSDFYWRKIEQGKTFKFLGNYFTVDMSTLPVVASNGIDCDDTLKYGDNFSNSAAIKFEGKEEKKGGTLILKNVSLNGNANVSSFKDAGEFPYHAGGVIMFKYKSITAEVENSIVKTSFISHFTDGFTTTTLKSSKAYDSNQSAIFTYEENEINLENCYMERAGGPLIMLRDTDYANPGHCSTLYVKDSYLVSKVCGQELFFVSKGAQPKLKQIAQMSAVLQANGFGTYATQKGDDLYVNAIVLILCAENDVNSILGATTTEGKVVIDKGTKTFTASKMEGDSVMNTIKQVQDNNVETPIFACEDNAALTTCYTGVGFNMAYPTDLTTNVPAQQQAMRNAVKTSFQNSDYVGLYYGGMTIVMGLNH